ncbi:MAG: pyruvate formate-lyase, partial [Clostridia bacterium]|nr:pyruvate formate-lyase [Clostridia bacterium]
SAVRYLIYDTKQLEKEVLMEALNANFEGYTECRNRLRNLPPKMGNNDDYADQIAACLMQCFSDTMNGMPNGQGGIWRAGTGSAMEYVLSSCKCPATANGRCAGEPFSANFSPSLYARLNGPLSVLQSFTKFDLKVSSTVAR